jgi:glycosyltransferase involved in cell wall biosynthesis
MLITHIQRVHRQIESREPVFGRSKRALRLNSDKILLVGMADSSHFQKWLKVLQQEFQNKEILVFPSDRPRFTRQKIESLTQARMSTNVFKLFPQGKINFFLYYVLDVLFGLKWRAYFLARYIIKHKPGVIHFHETQHGAYIFNLISTYKRIPNNSKNIISTWGSDLTLYSWVDSHQSEIITALSWADILTAEKPQEIIDAQRLGFTGEFRSPVYITLGQVSLDNTATMKPSLRKRILVKGYQDNPGRALNALYTISLLSEELKEFEVLVYSASEAVRIQCDFLRNKYSINIKALERISHEEMQELFRSSRISISLAISDGLPGALVEAMGAGAFPIQSENSCVGDFLVHGENGLIVDPWDLEGIKQSFKQALTDDKMVDKAVEINTAVLEAKYSLAEGTRKIKELYS